MIPFQSFALAGDATFTVTSHRTGQSFTYRVKLATKPRRPGETVHFVDLLTGPDNGADYRLLGMIYDRTRFAFPRNQRISPDAPSARAFVWTWEHRDLPEAAGVTIRHAGRCCRCGRMLTTPESIDRGIGPECLAKLG